MINNNFNVYPKYNSKAAESKHRKSNHNTNKEIYFAKNIDESSKVTRFNYARIPGTNEEIGIDNISPVGTDKNGNKILFDSKFLRLLYNPKEKWVYAGRPNVQKGGVNIIATVNKFDPTTKQNKEQVILIETRRTALNDNYKGCIEFPAGLVGDKKTESLTDAAKREFEEETKYEVTEDPIVCTENSAHCPGMVSEVNGFVVTRNTIPGKDFGRDLGEDKQENSIIRARYEIPMDQVAQWLKDREKEGYAISTSVFAGLYFLENKIQEDNKKSVNCFA